MPGEGLIFPSLTDFRERATLREPQVSISSTNFDESIMPSEQMNGGMISTNSDFGTSKIPIDICRRESTVTSQGNAPIQPICTDVFTSNICTSNLNPNASVFTPHYQTEKQCTMPTSNPSKLHPPEKNSIFQVTDDDDPKSVLQKLKTKNKDRPIIAHLNINFLDPKFEPLQDMIKDNVDILLISETKLNDTFPSGKFFIEGYKEPIRLDRNKNGGGLLFFIRDDLDSKEIKSHKLPKKVEGIFIKLTIRNTKWLIMGGYNPDKKDIKTFLNHVSKELDKFLPQYENLLLLGDFNSEMAEDDMKNFCETYNLTNLITDPTCFKSVENPSCIDVMLTNRNLCFENSMTIETGLSDFHKMTVTVMKKYYKKLEPITVNYRDYKSFDGDRFRNDLKDGLANSESLKLDDFQTIFNKILDFHAPKKQKVIRGNNAPFMNKTLSKAFMTRARLRNKYYKNPTPENKNAYTKQKNFCTNLLKREKKKYYNDLDTKIFDSNKKFWQRVKPLFSEKTMLKQTIRLKENGKMISDKKEVAEILNNYFMESVENLEVERYLPKNSIVLDENLDDIDKIVKQFQNHPSILKIKENVKIDKTFKFEDTNNDKMFKKISSLDANKACMKGDIPAKLLLGTNDIITPKLTKVYNNAKNIEKYPSCLKTADVTPIPKDKEKDNKKKYRPVSLTPTLSKVFEKDMYEQISNFVDSFLSPYLFGYRKGHSTEQCLMIMIEMWRKALDEYKVAGAVLTDLSKAFDCLPHDLLIAKLHAYGFEKSALNFIRDYLTERTQRTKVDGEYSKKRKLKYGVPQGSILGPLLFNLFINDIFYFLNESKLANYADDASTYISKKGIFPFLHALKSETEIVLNWFKINEMKSNSDKCHLIVAELEHRPAYISNTCIYLDEQKELLHSEEIVKLLGLWIDNRLTFEHHVKTLLKEGNQKLHALMRVSKYMEEEKLRILMKTFIESQFKYCPLLWMFHSKQINDRINSLQERALRVVYKDDSLTFEELLKKDHSFTTHERNLQSLAILMYKVKHNLCPAPIKEIFTLNSNERNFRDERNGDWVIPKVRTVNYGLETIRYRGPITWNLLPNEIKSATTLESFKAKVKLWKPLGCTCRICQLYVRDVGYINRPW